MFSIENTFSREHILHTSGVAFRMYTTTLLPWLEKGPSTCMYVCMYMCVCKYVYVYVCMYVSMYMYTHIHTHHHAPPVA